MNTHNLSTLQALQLLSRKCKSNFLQYSPKEFIRFLCECIVNLLKRKMQVQKETSRGKVSRRSLATIAKKNNLEARKKRSVVRKRIATNSRHYTSRH